MEAMVNWQGGLSFDGKADTGFHLHIDADTSVGGANGGFRPMELLAIGLAGCTAMDVISILQKKRQDVTGFQVLAHLERRDSHPKVFTRAVLEYLVSGHGIDQAAVLRSIELWRCRVLDQHVAQRHAREQRMRSIPVRDARAWDFKSLSPNAELSTPNFSSS